MTKPFSPFSTANQPELRGAKIHNVTVITGVTCLCGSSTPLQVVLIPGLDLKAVCPACQLNFKIMKLVYDGVNNPGNMQVSVGHFEPTIVKATAMPGEPSRKM